DGAVAPGRGRAAMALEQVGARRARELACSFAQLTRRREGSAHTPLLVAVYGQKLLYGQLRQARYSGRAAKSAARMPAAASSIRSAAAVRGFSSPRARPASPLSTNWSSTAAGVTLRVSR